MHSGFDCHPTAIVEPGATVGAGSHVWHHSHIRSGAVVGQSCNLGKNVYIDEGVTIGDRCKIQNNVSIFQGVELGDEVFVGPSAVFTNDRHPRACAPTDWQIVPTVVRTGVAIGANATIVCGVELAEWSTVGAGSVVTRSTAPHELVVGNPARRAGWTCRCGAVVSKEQQPPAAVTCEACGFVIDGALR